MRRSLAVLPGASSDVADAGCHTWARRRSCWPAVGRPVTSRRCWPSPTACAAATPTCGVTALGTETGLEARLVPARGYAAAAVPKVPLPAQARPATCCACPAACAQRWPPRGAAIDESGAQVVVGFGGYVSTPAYLAARRRRIPIVVHEQNARPGLANRARRPDDAVRRDDLPRHRAARTRRSLGMPLRREIAQLDRAARRDRGAGRTSGWTPHWPTVLVTGGSLGAQRLNTAVAAACAALQRRRAPGPAPHRRRQGVRARRAAVSGAPYVVVPYADRMDLAYAAADLVVAAPAPTRSAS